MSNWYDGTMQLVHSAAQTNRLSNELDHLCAAQEGSSLVGDFFLHVAQTSRTSIRGCH